MRLATIGNRLQLVVDGDYVDVATDSAGRFPADPVAALGQWDDLVQWGGGRAGGPAPTALDGLEAPVPKPPHVYAFVQNYPPPDLPGMYPVPTSPRVYDRIPTVIAGPTATIPIVNESIDWEVELVLVIGRAAQDVAEAEVWHHIAGVMVGQDISDRRPPAPAGEPQPAPWYGPTGPHLVTVDELADPDDLAISCSVNGDVVQRDRTSNLVFSVPEMVSFLSKRSPLVPGDVIFTGSPAGGGVNRVRDRFLGDGDLLVSTLETVGSIENTGRTP